VDASHEFQDLEGEMKAFAKAAVVRWPRRDKN
jgi:hypothetical protein